jgi:hypothetical protein
MSTCTYETPGQFAGDRPIPCRLRAVAGGSHCADHLRQVHKKKAEQRLALARAAGSEHEAMNAASAACAWMKEHRLVFYPRTEAIVTAVRAYSSATSEDGKRKTALGVAKASAGSQVLTYDEREEILGAARAAAARERQPSGTFVDQIVDTAFGWARTGVGFIGEMFGGVETRDGRPVVERAVREADQHLQEIRDAFTAKPRKRRAPAPAKRKTGKPAKTKAAKTARAKPKAAKTTRATRKPPRRAS